MKRLPVDVSRNGKKVWSVSVPGIGQIFFENYDAAMELCYLLDWLDQLLAGGAGAVWLEEAPQATVQTPARGSGNPVLHDVVSSLVVLSFILAAAGAVEQMHLSMIRQIKERLEKAVQAREGARVMTKGDVAVIMGDEWAKANLGTSLKDKLRTAGEPAPSEWVEMARAKQAALKKTPSPGM